MPPSSRIRPSRRAAQIAAITAVVVVIVLVIGFLADTLAASRAEHRVAAAVEESALVDFEPEVTLGGFGFLTRASDGRFPSMAISARGVTITGCGDRGACTATVDARLGDVTTGDVWKFDATTPIHTGAITAETRIDSVNLGRVMGITDLYINTPAPEGKAGGGGPGDGLLERTDGIMLSGTVPYPDSPEYEHGLPPSASGYTAPKVKISVSARVFVVDGLVHVEATDLYDGPEDHYSADVPPEFRAHVLKRFSSVLPPLPMAWNTVPSKALSRGSDLVVAGNSDQRIVKPIDYCAV
ncbi:LmeA family phospholipid-binding protein [Gordonia sp. (in: high G+C Gram-positive bacteria)]|uniref:LmeA family phospholipid-binding protein n=1 Tax=Gordonia sp. (in: high G+C Gram-positive bacteria) TaxID=84139 RepID=UPI003F961250